MRTRELPFAEWKRLRETELHHLADIETAPPGMFVVVVEIEGSIAACWAGVPTMHVEGLWITPARRHSAALGRVLWLAMMKIQQKLGVPEVVTTSISDEVDAMLEKVGGRPVPGQTWVFPVPPKE